LFREREIKNCRERKRTKNEKRRERETEKKKWALHLLTFLNLNIFKKV